MRLRVHDDAEKELREAARGYEGKRVGLGLEFLRRVIEAFGVIERHPRRYSLHPRLRSKREVRRYLLTPFQYAVVYDVTDEEVVVVAVAHTSRRPTYWRGRLGK